MTSYLRFQPADPAAGFPPGSVAVLSVRQGTVLGVLFWYPAWKEHVVESAPDVVWSVGCLKEVEWRLIAMNAERARTRPRRPAPTGPGGGARAQEGSS